MTLKKFKNEYRLICTDTWGDAMDAWFECAGQMNKRAMEIPRTWEYRPGLGIGTDTESYWYELFENAKANELVQIGRFLFRYCQYLKFKGKDY